LPFVPAGVAGVALTAFSAGLLGLYLRTPGMRHEGSLRPTEQGIPLSKDVWLVAIGASLVIDDLIGRGSRSWPGARQANETDTPDRAVTPYALVCSRCCQATWTTGRRSGSGSARRRISRVTGATSPTPKNR